MFTKAPLFIRGEKKIHTTVYKQGWGDILGFTGDDDIVLEGSLQCAKAS